MAAAYLMAHGTQAPLSIENMWELAALYTFVFLYIASQGAGIWSVDAACIQVFQSLKQCMRTRTFSSRVDSRYAVECAPHKYRFSY
jgi:hypothetical protein